MYGAEVETVGPKHRHVVVCPIHRRLPLGQGEVRDEVDSVQNREREIASALRCVLLVFVVVVVIIVVGCCRRCCWMLLLDIVGCCWMLLLDVFVGCCCC